MLSRIAESLFWVGRYSARAGATARMLDTHLRTLAEESSSAGTASCANLRALLQLPVPDEPDHADCLRLLAFDRSEPSSIVSSWSAARDNARRAREVIPLEVWECINLTWQQLPSGSNRGTQNYPFLEWARERTALFSGIAHATMVRDDGWQFLLLGRSLEQADMSSRIVMAASPSMGGTPWATVLRSLGAHDAFMRTYRGVHADREAAQFLILDTRLPRSVMHGLDAARRCLQNILRNNPTPSAEASWAERELGRIAAQLEYAPLDALLDDLDDQMAAVQDACAQVTGATSASFFAAADFLAWITEGAR